MSRHGGLGSGAPSRVSASRDPILSMGEMSMLCLRRTPKILALAVLLAVLLPSAVLAQTHKDTIHGY